MTAPRGVTYPYLCGVCGHPFYPDNGKSERGRRAGYFTGGEVICQFCIFAAIEHAETDREALDRRLAELGGAW